MAMRVAGLLSARRASPIDARSASLSEAFPRIVESIAARIRVPPPICHGAADARRKLSSAASRTLLESVGAADSDASSSAAFPPTCHGAAVEVNNLSSAAPPARPERFAVPLHLSAHSDTKMQMAHAKKTIMHSSRSCDTKIHMPHAKKTILHSSRSFSSGSLPPHESKVIMPQRNVIDPSQTGVIHPDLGHFRARGLDGARLPIVRQLSFYEEEDVYLTQWETPMDYLRCVLSLRPAYLNPLLKDPLVNDVDPNSMMHTKFMRRLWKSAMDLVTVNRLRGYCISKALVEGNLVVSRIHGTFALKRLFADDIEADPNDFAGFKAVKKLFLSLMRQRYGSDFMSMLMPDILDWLATLEDPIGLDGKLPTDHAWMLADEDRAWLSVRIAQILSGELKLYLGKETGRDVSQELLAALHPVSVGIDNFHPFFGAWHNHVRKVKENMADEGEEFDLAEGDKFEFDLAEGGVSQGLKNTELAKGGSWLVRMNRHGLLHSHTKEFSQIAGTSYRLEDVIGLLHFRLPMYLPSVQREFRLKQIWYLLEMARYFSRDTSTPQAKSRRRVIWLPIVDTICGSVGVTVI